MKVVQLINTAEYNEDIVGTLFPYVGEIEEDGQIWYIVENSTKVTVFKANGAPTETRHILLLKENAREL